jgi:hypothetical protein
MAPVPPKVADSYAYTHPFAPMPPWFFRHMIFVKASPKMSLCPPSKFFYQKIRRSAAKIPGPRDFHLPYNLAELKPRDDPGIFAADLRTLKIISMPVTSTLPSGIEI